MFYVKGYLIKNEQFMNKRNNVYRKNAKNGQNSAKNGHLLEKLINNLIIKNVVGGLKSVVGA